MSFRKPLDEALDAHDGGKGKVRVQREGTQAELDIVASGPIGVRVKKVKVTRDHDVDVEAEAARLPEGLRTLPERVTPIEVDKRLGGAILRSRAEDMRGGEYTQVDVKPRETEVRRFKAESGGRKAVEFDVTRDQLGRMLDELDGE